MKLISIYFCFLFIFATLGCEHLHRSPESGFSNEKTPVSQGTITTSPSSELRYRDVRTQMRVSNQNSKDSADNLFGTLSNSKKRQKVRELERKLDTIREKEQYSKVLPWLKSDDEKIEFLSVDSLEARQAWINKNKIFGRSQMNSAEMKDLVESQDIALGMPQEFVRKSWGDPQAVEVSGNPIYKNERWKYTKYVAGPNGHRPEKRSVYFEGGRVVGWETE